MQHHEEAEDSVWMYTGQDVIPETVRRVKIAENVSEIRDEAFQEHRQLEVVTLSSSVQVIGRWAFRGCKKLKSILYQGLDKEEVGIPSNVKVIEQGAFYGCTSLERLGLNEGLKRIEKGAFYGGESLTEVEIPSSVKVIDNSGFKYCKLLVRLVLNQGLERIGEDAFSYCESLTEVDCPSTVKVIEIGAFMGCKHLARLGLNEGLERIREYAFEECESLTEADIPSSAKVICYRAFNQCIRLATLRLNEGLEFIGEYAFEACESLSHVRIPQSINFIATTTFSRCKNLISIELPQEFPVKIDLCGSHSLVSVAGPITTFFPEGPVEFFQSSKLGTVVDDEDDLTRKLNHRFDNSPLNKLCYYHSYQSLDATMTQLLSLMEDGRPLAATMEVDEFGMTPLHVLSLSQTPNLDVLLAMMDAGKPGHMVRIMDSFGSTPMDYFFLNRMPNSSEVIRRLFQTRFEQVLGLDQFWEADVLQGIDAALGGDWASRKSEVGRVIRKFERKEILSLLELFLWKMMIDEATSKKVKIGEDTSKEEQILANRQRCRVMSGATVVIPHVLPFLETIS
eukprot:scaffold9087_cov107-Cylindrotheca_fusiformis.AAC.2